MAAVEKIKMAGEAPRPWGAEGGREAGARLAEEILELTK